MQLDGMQTPPAWQAFRSLLNQSKIPSCDTLVARCLDFIFKMYKKKDGGKKVKTKLLDGILKGPGKLVLCCLTIVR